MLQSSLLLSGLGAGCRNPEREAPSPDQGPHKESAESGWSATSPRPAAGVGSAPGREPLSDPLGKEEEQRRALGGSGKSAGGGVAGSEVLLGSRCL